MSITGNKTQKGQADFGVFTIGAFMGAMIVIFGVLLFYNPIIGVPESSGSEWEAIEYGSVTKTEIVPFIEGKNCKQALDSDGETSHICDEIRYTLDGCYEEFGYGYTYYSWKEGEIVCGVSP